MQPSIPVEYKRRKHLVLCLGVFKKIIIIMEWKGMKLINNKRMKNNGLEIWRTFSSVFGGL